MTLTETHLWDTYWGLGYSLRDIARDSGCNDTQVLKHMRRYGIPRRPPHGASPRTERQTMKGLVVRDPALSARLGLEAAA